MASTDTIDTDLLN